MARRSTQERLPPICAEPGIPTRGRVDPGHFPLGRTASRSTPGPESYHSPEAARITIHDGQVDRITSQGADLSAYELEPQLVTALFDAEQRSKREVVKYNDIPQSDGARRCWPSKTGDSSSTAA